VLLDKDKTMDNSILIYLHANLTAQGQLQSEHELRDTNKLTQIKSQCDSEEQVSNNNNNNNNNNNTNNINNNINSKMELIIIMIIIIV
jgi:hypothetical protein